MDVVCFQCGTRLYSPTDGSEPSECPSCCALCGEPADDEMTEFWNPDGDTATGNGSTVNAHAGCGLDAGFPMA